MGCRGHGCMGAGRMRAWIMDMADTQDLAWAGLAPGGEFACWSIAHRPRFRLSTPIQLLSLLLVAQLASACMSRRPG